MSRCFNGHRRERPNCAGCHHAHHVMQIGKVVNGRLVPPVVRGPDECTLCHEARHQAPVTGCPQCDGTFEDRVREAMDAAQPIRDEIWGLRFLHWFVGWRGRLAGWFGLLAGIGLGDWFERSDGSTNWFEFVLSAGSISVMQWAIKRKIARRERLLPRLGPRGELDYESDAAL